MAREDEREAEIKIAVNGNAAHNINRKKKTTRQDIKQNSHHKKIAMN